MLQEILTDLVVAIVIVFSAIVVIDFVVGLANLGVPKTVPSQDEQLFVKPVEQDSHAPVPVPDPWLETVVVPKVQQTSWSQWKPVLCLPLARVDKPDYSKFTAVQLRGICAAKGVAWRNAHCGKHLTKAQMIARLTA